MLKSIFSKTLFFTTKKKLFPENFMISPTFGPIYGKGQKTIPPATVEKNKFGEKLKHVS